MTSLIDRVVAHGLSTQFEDLPPAAVSAVKTFLLDSLGVGIAGAGHPLTAKVRQVALAAGGPGQAHSWGQGAQSVTPATAAFINGFQIHCQEFDCVHEPAVAHPMATILAALMAQIEGMDSQVSGRELAVALCVAVDLAAGLGVAAVSPLKFFRPATVGIFGATLGISRLRGFSAAEAKDALGYALAFCSGSMQAHVEGKPALPLQVANAARGAVMACDVAAAGIAGPEGSLDGPFGYFSLFEDEVEPARLSEALGKIWRIAEVSHKPYPTGRACQGGIWLIQQALAQGLDVAQIESVELSAPPLIRRLVGRPWQADMSTSYARLCFQYCGAMALQNGRVGLEDFSEAALRDAAIAELAQRIQVVENGDTDPAAFAPQRLTIRLKSGATAEHVTTALFGSPDQPLTAEQNIEKFRSCTVFGFGQEHSSLTDTMISRVSQLETLSDAAELARLAAALEPAQ